MRCIGAYKVLYNPDYHVLCRPNGEFVFNVRSERSFNKTFYERKEQELEFHVNLWNLLKQNHNDYADEELLVNLILLLSDSSNETTENLSFFIEELFKLTTNEDDMEFESVCQRLVRTYKNLNPGPLIIPVQKENESNDFTFNPTINRRSREIANQSITKALYRNSSTNGLRKCTTKVNFTSRVRMMYDKKKEIEERCRQLREQKERQELEKCTFQPVISQYTKRATTRVRRREVGIVKNPGKENERNGNQRIVRKVLPVKTNPHERIEREPLMKVEVNISPNRKGIIVLYKGESLYNIIENFARVHQLSKDNIEDLYQQLKEQTDLL